MTVPSRATRSGTRDAQLRHAARLLSAVLLLAATGFADTIINNFTGYNDYWGYFGDQPNATQTYGEVFTAPEGVSNIDSFSFYFGNPIDRGDIVAGGYVAPASIVLMDRAMLGGIGFLRRKL